jgi:hypothetical protein
MTDRPIIFSAPMVRALLDGRKTQTRRVLKVQPPEGAKFFAWDLGPAGAFASFIKTDDRGNADLYPSRLTAWRGDSLWVKEAWRTEGRFDHLPPSEIPAGSLVHYEADGPAPEWAARSPSGRYRHARFMPRRLSRITCSPILDVRVQRLLDISEADAYAEGVDGRWTDASDSGVYLPPSEQFRTLWNSLHGPDAWDANPWVCALTFTVHKCNIDQMGADNG